MAVLHDLRVGHLCKWWWVIKTKEEERKKKKGGVLEGCLLFSSLIFCFVFLTVCLLMVLLRCGDLGPNLVVVFVI